MSCGRKRKEVSFNYMALCPMTTVAFTFDNQETRAQIEHRINLWIENHPLLRNGLRKQSRTLHMYLMALHGAGMHWWIGKNPNQLYYCCKKLYTRGILESYAQRHESAYRNK